MSTGIPTNRTNIELPAEVSAEIMQKVQLDSAVMKLARRIALPGRGASINVITSDPEASWVGETEAKPVSNPGVATKVMSAYKLAVVVPFSNEFRRDAEALYEALVERLPRALAAKFDATVLTGSAPGSNFDTLASVTAQAIGSDAYGGLVAADTDVAVNGGIMNGVVLSPQGKGILLASKDQTGRPLFINNVAEGAVPMVLGARTELSKGAYKAGSPNVVGIVGDWTQALYGTVEGVQISIADQASLTYTENDETKTINLFQQNMFAVRAEIEIGFRADTSVFNKLTATTVSA
jgi:HK97 family phage major capsid protein